MSIDTSKMFKLFSLLITIIHTQGFVVYDCSEHHFNITSLNNLGVDFCASQPLLKSNKSPESNYYKKLKYTLYPSNLISFLLTTL